MGYKEQSRSWQSGFQSSEINGRHNGLACASGRYQEVSVVAAVWPTLFVQAAFLERAQALFQWGLGKFVGR